jgi:hypothetical protein
MTRSKSHRFDEYSDNALVDLYSRDWSVFVQKERDDATLEMGFKAKGVNSVADMSAGGSHITPTIATRHDATMALGDLWEGYGYKYFGPISHTVPLIDPVDLFVCTETLEHLKDPDEALHLIRQKTRLLLLSTPIWEEPELVSHGHLWTWRRDDIEVMLDEAGFTPIDFTEVSIFGVWLAE